jgi:DNA-binding LacI/PurR family transcriptional regulator
MVEKNQFKEGAVTQKAIAERSGAAASLVSRILSGKLERHIAVSEEKRLRIICIAEELGYCN